MRISVIVKANAKENKIEKSDTADYKVYLKEKPVDGKANLELVKLLSKYFKSNVRIVSGFNYKRKIVELYSK